MLFRLKRQQREQIFTLNRSRLAAFLGNIDPTMKETINSISELVDFAPALTLGIVH